LEDTLFLSPFVLPVNLPGENSPQSQRWSSLLGKALELDPELAEASPSLQMSCRQLGWAEERRREIQAGYRMSPSEAAGPLFSFRLFRMQGRIGGGAGLGPKESRRKGTRQEGFFFSFFVSSFQLTAYDEGHSGISQCENVKTTDSD